MHNILILGWLMTCTYFHKTHPCTLKLFKINCDAFSAMYMCSLRRPWSSWSEGSIWGQLPQCNLHNTSSWISTVLCPNCSGHCYTAGYQPESSCWVPEASGILVSLLPALSRPSFFSCCSPGDSHHTPLTPYTRGLSYLSQPELCHQQWT